MSKSKEQESLILDPSLNETQYNNVPKSSRVFISYSHDSSKHEECVLQLSNRLCREGIDSNIDQYETSPSEGWFRWMVNQIEEADYVLIVCTENYEKRFKGKEEAGKGLGAKWESAIITQELYYFETKNKCIPVVFSPEDSKYIPSILKDVTYYNLNTKEGYNKLYARLTSQKLIKKPAVGKLRQIPPRNLSPTLSIEDEEGTAVKSNQKPVIGKLREMNAESQVFDTPITNTRSLTQTTTSSFAGMEFILIPEGKFMMGSAQKNRAFKFIRDAFRLDEFPLHEVTINYQYYLGKFPVTQKQWKNVMGSIPCTFKGNDYPVENVSWYDTQLFIKKLNEMEGMRKYRLPSEAEWEYACRAGTETLYCFGDDKSKLKEYSWNTNFSLGETHPVGQKKPNHWGLYDMHGNVCEWVQDTFHGDYNNAPSNGDAWEDETSSKRIRRGGCWSSFDWFCRSSIRLGTKPTYQKNDTGFRLLREL